MGEVADVVIVTLAFEIFLWLHGYFHLLPLVCLYCKDISQNPSLSAQDDDRID